MFKKLLGAILLAGVASVSAFATVPAACNTTATTYKPGNGQLKLMIAGSSAMWATTALGAYNKGVGITGAVGGTYHYIGASKFTMSDTRLTQAFGTSASNTVTDQGSIWIVWDNHTTVSGTTTYCTPQVWAYIQLDSVIGNRAFFAQGTNVSVTSAGVIKNNPGAVVFSPSTWPAGGGTLNAVLGAFWGDSSSDSTVPANVQALFSSSNSTGGAPVNVGATDVRPEDAFFASNRVNSSYSSSGAYSGLGYNTTNTAGALPANTCQAATNYTGPFAQQSGAVPAPFQGKDILGDFNGDSAFHVVAFNIQGQDPVTCAPIPAWSVLPLGASPIVFLTSYSKGTLTNLTNATEHQLQQVFSAANGTTAADASMLGLPAGAIAAFLREPLSGTMNTTEETVFRHPSALATYRFSQEAGIDGGSSNPVGGSTPSATGTYVLGPGNLGRWRAIGTGDEVKSVKGSGTSQGLDGIGYAFFSYGNVQPVNTGSYHYIQVNGVDPIFHNYVNGTAGVTDPGQSSTPGTVPAPGTLPAGCSGKFPCAESAIWAASPTFSTGLSFPNVRNGSYPAWSVLRLIVPSPTVNASVYSLASALITASNQFVVSTTPDYVPYAAVKSGTTVIDPGLPVIRSHFGCIAQACNTYNWGTGVSTTHLVANNPETGRDAGGSIVPLGDIKTGQTQDAVGGFVTFQ